MRKLILLLPLFIFMHFSNAAADAPVECVVLLHGLARTEKSMHTLERYLADQGFSVINLGYPSRKETIQKLSEEVIPAAIERCQTSGANKIHFVTHSMGAILVRYYLASHDVPHLGRVVMLSPPNSGSEVVDTFKDLSLFKTIYGPAAQQLGTGADSLPRALGPPDYEVGIITGDRTINPIFSLLISGEDDGTVSVESARLQGMQDFLLVHDTHPFIMYDEQVLAQVTAFIRSGKFNRATGPSQ